MTILAEIHSGHDPTVYRIPCLELSCPAWAEPIRFCPGWDDVTVTHEDEAQAIYIGGGLDTALPARNDSGQQRLVFAFGGANSEAEELEDQATEAGEIITLTLRMYASDDLSAPAQRPKRMIVDTLEFLPNGVLQVSCTYRDILSRRFLQGRFTANKYPGVALF